jgi:hypothetical protein
MSLKHYTSLLTYQLPGLGYRRTAALPTVVIPVPVMITCFVTVESIQLLRTVNVSAGHLSRIGSGYLHIDTGYRCLQYNSNRNRICSFTKIHISYRDEISAGIGYIDRLCSSSRVPYISGTCITCIQYKRIIVQSAVSLPRLIRMSNDCCCMFL